MKTKRPRGEKFRYVNPAWLDELRAKVDSIPLFDYKRVMKANREASWFLWEFTGIVSELQKWRDMVAEVEGHGRE
jgi:hypothetical protein